MKCDGLEIYSTTDCKTPGASYYSWFFNTYFMRGLQRNLISLRKGQRGLSEDQSSCFVCRILDITAAFRLFLFPSVWSLECPLTTVPWAWHPIIVMTFMCHGWPVGSVSPLLRWFAPLSHMAAAGNRNSRAASFFCAGGLALHVWQRHEGRRKGNLMKQWKCVG